MAHDEFCTPFLFGVASSAAERQTQFLGQLPASVSNTASSPPNIFTPYRVCVCVCVCGGSTGKQTNFFALCQCVFPMMHGEGCV